MCLISTYPDPTQLSKSNTSFIHFIYSFTHLANVFKYPLCAEKTLVLGKIESRRRRVWQRMR